jgi:hypothetical protein
MHLTIGRAVQLWEWMETVDRLDALTNQQLADVVEDELWVDLPVMTPMSDLLRLVVERLRQSEVASAGPQDAHPTGQPPRDGNTINTSISRSKE